MTSSPILIPDMRLHEILDGCKDVTPGPWIRSGVRQKVRDEDCLMVGPDSFLIAALPIGRRDAEHAGAFRDAGHIARLDPTTVASIVSELLHLRANHTARADVAEGRRDYRALHAEAVAAVKAFDDWANVNETEFTGWGEGDVPPEAEFWRVKSGQSLKALLEIRPSPSQGDSA